MHMIMFVLNDPNRLDDVLDAWRAVGISGATIVESSGFYRRHVQRLGARYLFALPQMVAGGVEEGSYTLFVAVPDEKAVQRCAAAAEEIVGDLNTPHTGVLFAWELAVVKGVPDELLTAEDEE